MMIISVNDSIARILQTPIGSRALNPTFGSRLHELIDKTDGEGFRADASRYAHEALKLEPRITTEKVIIARQKMLIEYSLNDELNSLEIAL
jgi:phage baseplate assembly protein W